MKYDITYSCGHTGTVELFGPGKDRERKLWWYSNKCDCPTCYEAQKAAKMAADNYVEREMHYGDYKRNYSDCKTKNGSYNPKTKTIIVYIKADVLTA